METIFGKARGVVLSSIHALLDQAIDLNKVGNLEVYIRDLGKATQEVEDLKAVAHGRARSLAQQIISVEASIKTTDENIDLLLADGDPSNDHFAAPLEQKLMGLEQELETLKTEKAGAETEERELSEAASKLRAKYESMTQRLGALRMQERSAAAKTRAADALTQVAGVAGRGPDIDNLERKIHERSAVADARFEQAVGGVSSGAENAVLESQAAARLAARRKRLEGEAAAKPAAA